MSDVKTFNCEDCAHMCEVKMLISDTGDFPDMCVANRTIRDGYVDWKFQRDKPVLIDKESLLERFEDILKGDDSEIYDQLLELKRVIEEGYLDA